MRRGAPLSKRRRKTEGRRLTATRASGGARGACTTDPDPTMLQTTHGEKKGVEAAATHEAEDARALAGNGLSEVVSTSLHFSEE